MSCYISWVWIITASVNNKREEGRKELGEDLASLDSGHLLPPNT